ncbi:hypothetical protein BGX34_003979 [Mortierella sp. NVP85]|nr:hypothetical protein BGX34_003979 [Mortierella sp. NVP85]
MAVAEPLCDRTECLSYCAPHAEGVALITVTACCKETEPSEPKQTPRPHSWTAKALSIPEIVLLIQERLDRSCLCASLRISRFWYCTGRHLVWKAVEWSNNLELGPLQEMALLQNSHRFKTLRCVFHPKAGSSNIDSSSLLRSIVDGYDETLVMDPVHSLSIARNALSWSVPPKRQLRELYITGHFVLQRSKPVKSNPARIPAFISFNIPTLTRLDIRPAASAAVDIHLILDSATRLEHLVIHSQGAFVNSASNESRARYPYHHSLLSLTIRHLELSREELESVVVRCPSLIEFHSLCSPGTLWKERPLPAQQPQQQQTIQSKSLVLTLADNCPRLQDFRIGLQQGGLPLDSIREAITSIPKLQTLGLPAWDCTKVTMDAIKAIQIESTRPKIFLTSLCIMNVCSSEKVSQAIHDYLCWTPYLREFYAYNTTLYVDQMQCQQQEQQQPLANGHSVVRSRSNERVPVAVSREETNNQTNWTSDAQSILKANTLNSAALTIPTTPGSTATAAVMACATHTAPVDRPTRQWACTRLERLVVRFAHLPWRNLTSPPKRSKDTFAFLKPLQNLKYLKIKEGLMLEAGREYEALAELKGLEEVVFTMCYPIPIKPTDMAWMDRSPLTLPCNESGLHRGEKVNDGLKRVVVRRLKENTVLDKEISQWFRDHRPDVKFLLELIDCCEEECTF